MTRRRETAAAPKAWDKAAGVRHRAAPCASCVLLISLLLLPILEPGRASARVIGVPAGAGPAAATSSLDAPLRTPFKVARLDAALAELAAVSRSGGRTAGSRYAAARGLELTPGGVEVLIVARDARPGSLALVRRAVARSSGEVLSSHDDLVSGRVPAGGLVGLAASPGVLSVQVPERGVPDAVSEGVPDMAAEAWHVLGLDGSGMKVGIIDAGFKGYQAQLGIELPETVTVWGRSSQGVEGGTDTDTHGTSVAEVVHDVAPGAELYLARPQGVAELGNAVDWLRAQGVAVINQSMSRFGYGNSGTGAVNEIIDEAVAGDVFWANSAGNYRLGHWMGDFGDPDGDGWLDWDGVPGHDLNTFIVRQGREISGKLWWDDSWTAASQDYDLVLLQWNGSSWSQLASSTNEQAGRAGQRPYESVYVASAPAWTHYAWRVYRAGASHTDVDFDLVCPDVSLDNPNNTRPHYFVHARSLGSPADNASSGFMAVAAVLRGPGFAAADYSSVGPTRDGRLQPEVSGPTAVTNVSDPTPPFAGTSAASPHVAGIAAILRQAYPAHTAAEIEELVKASTVDLGAAGPDAEYGWGRILLSAPTDRTPPVTTVRPARIKVKKGRTAALSFGVEDPGFSAGPVTVTLEVRNARGKVVARHGPYPGILTTEAYDFGLPCPFAKGTYRVSVKAVDAAGNAAVQVGTAILVVTK